MKEPKDHLNIDLDFLDKKEPVRVAKKPEPEGAKSTTNTSSPTAEIGGKWNWKNILIVGGIVLFFGWAIFSGSSDSSSSGSSYTPTSSGTSDNLLYEGGQTFRCSDYNYNRAVQLRPSSSLGAQLATESKTLDAQISANKAEKASIEATYVDENDEYEVDNYNARIDRYNAERQRLMNAVSSWEQRSKAFDAQIDTYNNFLDTNCRPQ